VGGSTLPEAKEGALAREAGLDRPFRLSNAPGRAARSCLGDGRAAQLAEVSRGRDPDPPRGTCSPLTDRLDPSVGFFGVGTRPTGTADPHALWRAANGTLSLLWGQGAADRDPRGPPADRPHEVPAAAVKRLGTVSFDAAHATLPTEQVLGQPSPLSLPALRSPSPDSPRPSPRHTLHNPPRLRR
jgi:hypothetical protein